MAIYAFSDYQFSSLGTLFTLLSTFMMVWEGLLKRHLLTDRERPLVLSLQAMVLINNAFGCALALLLFLSYEVWIIGYDTLPNIALDELLYICASIFLSALYHYMGLQLARAVSATTLLAGTNLSKILIVVYGAMALGDTATMLAWSGVTLAILGNVIYMLARLHVMHQQALLREAVTDEDLEKEGRAADITTNIREKPEDEEKPVSFEGAGEATADWLRQRVLDPLGGRPAAEEVAADAAAQSADAEDTDVLSELRQRVTNLMGESGLYRDEAAAPSSDDPTVDLNLRRSTSLSGWL